MHHKGQGSGTGVHASPVAEDVPPAERPDLTRAETETERGKPVALPEGQAHRKGSPWSCGETRREHAKAALAWRREG